MRYKFYVRFFYLFCLLMIAGATFSQNNNLFDTSKIGPATKLLGLSIPYSKKDANGQNSFLVTDPELIKRIIISLPIERQSENKIDEAGIYIDLIQNFEVISSHRINPIQSTIIVGGIYFEFDLEKLNKLTSPFICDYQILEKNFNNRSEFEFFLEEQKKDTNFLFYNEPDFKTEGSFEIEFPRNKKFSSPKVCIEYVNPMIEKIVSSSEYLAIYRLSPKNRDNQDQFTITIIGSKRIFDELELKNLEKKKWTESIPKGSFYYLKKTL